MHLVALVYEARQKGRRAGTARLAASGHDAGNGRSLGPAVWARASRALRAGTAFAFMPSAPLPGAAPCYANAAGLLRRLIERGEFKTVREDSLGNGEIKFAHTHKCRTGFCGASRLECDDFRQIEPMVQDLVKIGSVHAQDPVATPECTQSILCESGLANDEAAGPIRLTPDFTIEGAKRFHGDRRIPPSCFQQIGISVVNETAVDLLAPATKRGTRGHFIGVEYVPQEFLECITPGLRFHAGNFDQIGGERGYCSRVYTPFAMCGERGFLRQQLAFEPFDDMEKGCAHRITEFWIVSSNAARLAVFPQCFQRRKSGLTVCLS